MKLTESHLKIGKHCFNVSRSLKLHLQLLWLCVPCIVLNGMITTVRGIVTDHTMSLAFKTNTNNYDEYKDPHFMAGRTVIVYLFEWKFSDVEIECKDFLGPKGFGGVQLSPVTQHLLIQTEQYEHPWWEKYQPISYEIETRAGNEDNLRDMLKVCNAEGVRVYIDVVLNHMAGMLNNDTDITESTNDSFTDYTNFSRNDFHEPCDMVDFANAHQIRNCQLNGMPDLDQSSSTVQTMIINYLNKLIDMGVAGFRINAAKYMWPIELKHIYESLNNLNSAEFNFPENSRPFIMQEIFDMGVDSVSKTEYASYGLVTEYLYATELAFVFNGQSPAITLLNTGPALGLLASLDTLICVDLRAVTFSQVDLTDLRILTYKRHSKYIMANAFMLMHPYGHIRQLMSSYVYTDHLIDKGPPTAKLVDGDDEVEIVRSPEFDDNGQCVAEFGWICEHRWPPIVQLIAMSNSFCNMEDGVTNFQSDSPHQIAFCRGDKAFIAINNDRELTYAGELHTCLPAGIYCDIISGGINANNDDCLGKSIIVNEEGNAQISIAPVIEANLEPHKHDDSDNGVIVIYVGSKLA